MPEQRKYLRNCFESCQPVQSELRLKKYWLKCLSLGKSQVNNRRRQPRRLQRISRSLGESLSIQNSKRTSIAKLFFLSLLGRLRPPKVLLWLSRRSTIPCFPSPTLSDLKT